MKNNKKTIDKSTKFSLIIFLIVFVLIIICFFIYNRYFKKEYSCTDYSSNTLYTFKSEKEMHEVCDKFNGIEDDKILSSYDIYDDLVNTDDPDFVFYPYVNVNGELSIIIAISNCENPSKAKEKAIAWFKNHSYNINDYTIEYEYPCEQ